MGIYLEILLFLVLSTASIWCCSQDGLESLVENAHISCPFNDSCTAECYMGYISSDGERETTYKCQNNSWSSTHLACKRIPVVSIKYYTIWDLNVLPKFCNNATMHNSISEHLEDSKERLEEQFINICKFLNVEVNVNFTYSFRAFELWTTFNTEYGNASSMNNIDLCIAYTSISFWNVPTFRNMIDNITCNGSIITYKAYIKLNITEKREICYQNTNVKSVTVSDMDNDRKEMFCDNLTTSINSTVPEQTSKTTITYESPSELSNFCLEIPQILFLTIPAAVILILVTATITALVSKRSNSKKTRDIDHDDVILRQIQPTDLEMKDIIQMNNYRGKLIENDLYQRASGVHDGGTYSGINDTSTSDAYSTVVKDYNVVRDSSVVRESNVVRDSNVVRNSNVVGNTNESGEGHLPYSVENIDTESMPEDYLYSQVQKNKIE